MELHHPRRSRATRFTVWPAATYGLFSHNGVPGEIRTLDAVIKSHMLCQLSYWYIEKAARPFAASSFLYIFADPLLILKRATQNGVRLKFEAVLKHKILRNSVLHHVINLLSLSFSGS